MAERRRLPITVVLLGLTSFFTDAGSEMIFPLLSVFLTETLHASPSYLGLVEGVADTISSLLKLASGKIADLTRRKKPLVLFGYGIASAVRPLMALAMAPWQVLAVRVTDRVGKGIRSSPRDALIADAAGEHAGRAFGFHRAMDHAGAVVGPLVALGLLALGCDVRTIFWIAVIPGVIATLLVLLVRERVAPPPAAPDLPGAAAKHAAPIPRALRTYLVILFVFSLGNASDAFLLLRARDFGISTPLIWAAFHVVKLVSSYLAGDLSDRVPRVRLILVGWAIYAVTYVGFGLASAAWHVWALFLVYGAYYGLTEPAEKALVRDLAPPEIRGKAYGWYNLVVGLAALPAGLLTGGLWAEFGPGVALAASAALAGIAAALLVGWSRRQESDLTRGDR